MKNIAVIAFLAVMVISTPAIAGKSWVFSDQDELNINKAIKAADPNRQIEVSFSENYWDGSLVDCTTSRPEEFVQIFIHCSGDVQIIGIGSEEEKTKRFAEKIKKKVETIFNRPASEDLGRDFLK